LQENDHGPLQIICKYYQLSCLARGSALTFHPLEHLHPLEYHRPAVTVLCRTGSTIDLENFSTGLDLADVCCHNNFWMDELAFLLLYIQDLSLKVAFWLRVICSSNLVFHCCLFLSGTKHSCGGRGNFVVCVDYSLLMWHLKTWKCMFYALYQQSQLFFPICCYINTTHELPSIWIMLYFSMEDLAALFWNWAYVWIDSLCFTMIWFHFLFYCWGACTSVLALPWDLKTYNLCYGISN
jgi:hypothetical protein